ncbi:GAF domain-containing protein [Hymenobacter sp. HSC-4F20]|uniref:GAF domain-containing protein n=1 Tax=Hymenobacter sp. HSC-4F20 TaxID=2864135 RepID=UPI001C7356E2|nr:GAF domain-containing protein [Hymenobacter sp. HSC-4F20]MBX0290247.1 GAF domain-containing protein [Hymenobacter sp. HSC-4F20]
MPPRAPNPVSAPTLDAFVQVLRQQGVHAALGYLNRYTPHRYTGIYRFCGGFSRNVVLFDRYKPQVRQGEDVPLAEAFCSLVGRQQAPLQLVDATLDPRARQVNTLVVSYCGVPIRDEQGQLYGTLCHYDLELCQEMIQHVPLLETVAPLLYRAVQMPSELVSLPQP